MRRPRRKRRAPPRTVGATPGTLRIHPDAPRPVVRVMAYGPDDFSEQEVEDPESLAPLLGKWPVTWVNVDGLGDAETLTRIGEIFRMHPLALEDAVNVPQRAKVEQYGENIFIVTRMVSLGEHLETEQLSLFLGCGVVVTFQEHAGDCLEPVRERIRKGTGRLRSAGADYLVYALLDAVIDAYFPVLEQRGEHLEMLEDQVIAHPDSSMIARIHTAKRDLLALRRAIWPQREAINSLLRDPIDLIAETTHVYLRDCYDHVIQVIDVVETYRELASGLLDAYQSSVANRMNEVMKVLTIIATIFIPLGFLAGIWGMNFDPEASPFNMPELGWRYGYPVGLALMATVAVCLLLFFWRRGWLGSSGAPSAGGTDTAEHREAGDPPDGSRPEGRP